MTNLIAAQSLAHNPVSKRPEERNRPRYLMMERVYTPAVADCFFRYPGGTLEVSHANCFVRDLGGTPEVSLVDCFFRDPDGTMDMSLVDCVIRVHEPGGGMLAFTSVENYLSMRGER